MLITERKTSWAADPSHKTFLEMNPRSVFVVIIACHCLLGCRDGADTPSSLQPTQGTNRSAKISDESNSRHGFGDFSFTIPNEWKLVTPDRNKTKAMLLLDGTSWQNAKAMIKVDVGSPTAPTAEALAKTFAAEVGGTVSQEPLDFDGASGIYVSTSSTNLATPRIMILILRRNQLYLVMAAAVTEVDVSSPIATIRESWKWTN